MNLRIVTPLAVVIEEDGVRALRAEDASGSFGILPGHADFLTSLAIAAIRWLPVDGPSRYAAIRGGVLTVEHGQSITIATREAVIGTDLGTLDEAVLDRFRTELEAERTERVEATRLHLTAIRQIMRHLRPGAPGGLP